MGPAVLFLASVALLADVYLFSTNASLACCMRVSALFAMLFMVVILIAVCKRFSRTNATNSYSRLGQILLSSHLITEEELKKALQEQKRSRLPLGAILVQAGAISHRELRRALESQVEVRRGYATMELALARLTRSA
jgi:hypothetical protein